MKDPSGLAVKREGALGREGRVEGGGDGVEVGGVGVLEEGVEVDWKAGRKEGELRLF